MNRLKSLGILFYFFFFFKCTEGSIHTTQHLNLYLRDLSVTEVFFLEFTLISTQG